MESEESVLLTRAAACDPDIVDKLDRYVAGGGKALVTSGFLEATMDRGIQRMTSIRLPGRRVRGRNYRVESAGPFRAVDYPRGREDISVPVCVVSSALFKTCSRLFLPSVQFKGTGTLPAMMQPMRR